VNEEQISGLGVKDKADNCSPDKQEQWFELIEDYEHKSIFASQLIPKGTRLMFRNLTMGKYWFKFTIKMENLCGVSELGLRQPELRKLEVKEIQI